MTQNIGNVFVYVSCFKSFKQSIQQVTVRKLYGIMLCHAAVSYNLYI